MTELTIEDYYKAQIQFENTSHDALYKWAQKRSGFPEGAQLDILDLSCDCALFSQILADRMKAKTLVVALRNDKDKPHDMKLVPFTTVKIDISGETFPDVQKLGKFDIIILKEMLYECKDHLDVFLEACKDCLKSPTASRIFALCRPKNPPVPLPDPAMFVWRKMTPSKEEIVTAGHKAGFKQDYYSASIPIRIEKQIWSNILMSRCLAAVKACAKCTDKEIRDFIKLKTTPKFEFEEKLVLMVLWLEGEAPKEDE